jgi:phage-related protein
VTSIADAYVELHVDGDKLAGETRTSVKGAEKSVQRDFDKAGASLGDHMAQGFLGGFGKKVKSGGGGMGSSLKGSFMKGFNLKGSIGDAVKTVRTESDAHGRSLGAALAGAFVGGFARNVKSGAGKMSSGIKDAFKGFSPRGLMIPALAAAVPLATSAVSALSGALVAFTGAVVQASTSAISMVGVVGALIQAKMTMKIATSGVTAALKGEEGAMKKLTESGRGFVKAVKGLTPEWNGLKRSVEASTFAGLGKVLRGVASNTLPVLRKGLTGTGQVLNGLFKRMGGWLSSARFAKQFGNVLQGNNRTLRILGRAAVPMLKGILNVFQALQPSGGRLAQKIVDIARAFKAWSSAPGTADKIRAFMDRAWKSAGNLWGILKNLGTTIRNVFGAATPAGGGLLKTLNDLTGRLARFTELASTKNAIAEWAQQGIDISGRLFSALGRGFQMIAPLFNPAILGGFMDMFGKMMPTIQSVVGVLQSALAPVLQTIGDAFAENGPKFAALFEALKPLLGGIGAVIGQIISQALSMLGTIAAVITPVVRVISGVLGPVLTKFAPVIAFVILAFTNWGGAIVKLIPIVGKFLAPIVKLATWVAQKLGPAFRIAGKVIGLAVKAWWKVVSTVVGFIVRGVGKAFGFIARVIGSALRVAWNIVRTVWNGIKTVIGTVLKVIGTVVRTYFNIYKKIVQTVLNVIKTVFRTVWNAIKSVVSGVLNAIKSVVSNVFNGIKGVARTVWNAIKSTVTNVVQGIKTAVSNGFNTMKTAISNVWSAVKTAASTAWTAIKNVVSNGVTGVVNFIKGIPDKIAGLAGQFLSAGTDLGSKVISGIGDGLRSAAGFVSDIGSAVKGAINSALNLPFTIRGPGPLPDFTIPAFARGGVAPGGPALVGERGPELVNLPRGSRVHSAADTRRLSAQVTMPRRMVLRIGARDFVAYVEEVADGRIEAADSLSWQGA